jgi:hypothetical protein
MIDVSNPCIYYLWFSITFWLCQRTKTNWISYIKINKTKPKAYSFFFYFSFFKCGGWPSHLVVARPLPLSQLSQGVARLLHSVGIGHRTTYVSHGPWTWGGRLCSAQLYLIKGESENRRFSLSTTNSLASYN